MPLLYLSSNFSFDGFDGKREYDYSRSGNPTRDVLATAITEPEGGHGAVITNTGMSAVVLVTHLLKSEDTILAPHNCYGGCYRAFTSLSEAGRFKTRFVDFTDTAAVHRVHYPGLSTHPEHQLARAQQSGFGAIVSFELNGGETQLRAFLNGLTHFTLRNPWGALRAWFAILAA